MEGEGPGPRPHSGAGRVGEWRNISTRASGVWGVVCEGEKIACRWRDRDEQGGGRGQQNYSGAVRLEPFRSVPGSAGWP